MQSKLFLFLLPLIALSYPLEQNEIVGKCLKVLDGDTIILSRGDKELKVRLAFIDAPEIKQRSFYNKNPIGKMSQKYLEELILNKKIKLITYGKGKYGRTLGEVYLNNENINRLMVEEGMALLYKFSPYPSNMHRAQYHSASHRAQISRRGLWKEFGFYRPDIYRRVVRHKKSPQ